MKPQKIESPCIGICTLDNNDTCSGCLRTMPEIATWLTLSDERKLEILKRKSVNKQ